MIFHSIAKCYNVFYFIPKFLLLYNQSCGAVSMVLCALAGETLRRFYCLCQGPKVLFFLTQA